LKDFHLQRGEALCLHTVKLHKQQGYGPVHVALGDNNVNGEFWAIVSDEPTNLQTFRDMGCALISRKRFSMTNRLDGIYRNQRSILSAVYLAFGFSWPLQRSMSWLKGLQWWRGESIVPLVSR
jgi:hypothetical protein